MNQNMNKESTKVGVYAEQNPPGTGPQKVGEISIQVDDIIKNITTLLDCLNLLEKKLLPILSAYNCAEDEKKDGKIIATPLGENLNTINCRVQHGISRIQELLHRVEI